MSAAAEAQPAPFDTELEQSILGKMLADGAFIDVAAAEVEAHHFHDGLHQRLFDMVVHLQGEGDANPVLVASVMRTDPAAATPNFSLPDYIHSMAFGAPVITDMRGLLKRLRDLAFRRDIIRIGKEMAEAALGDDAETPAQAIADFATEELLQAGSETAKPALTPYEIGLQTIRELEQVKAGKPIPGVKTGFDKLDREIGCLRGGDFITILAKSGMGKSALMGALALNMARAGTPVIFFSLEMTRSQLVERMVCDLDFDTAEKAMWYSRVRNHHLNDQEFDRFVLANQHLNNLPLEICDDDGLTIAQISTRARAFVAKHGKNLDGTKKMGCIIGDYLQIVEPADNRENRERQVARIARGCKSLAKRTVWPVIFGSQMNEKDEDRAGDARRPRASDARESKAIRNESDMMFSPYRPAVAVEDRKPLDALPGDPADLKWRGDLREVRNRFELLALKNRHGRRFDIEMWCDMGASAIRDEAPYHEKSDSEQAAQDMLEGI